MKTRIFNNIDRNTWFRLFGFIIFACVLSPQLQGAFSWDDNVLAGAKGAAAEHGWNLFGLMYQTDKALFFSQGRLFPFTAIILLPLYYLNRFFYKFSIFILILGNLWLFSKLMEKLTRSKELGTVIILLAPLFFFLRFGGEALSGFGWLLQLEFFYLVISSLAFFAYCNTGSQSAQMISLMAYGFALLTYEMSYAFCCVPFIIALFANPESISKKKIIQALNVSKWHFLLTGSIICILILCRKMAGMPWYGINTAYIPHLDTVQSSLTLFKNAVAALPLSYPLLSDWREMEQMTFVEIRKAITGSHKEMACFIFLMEVGVLWAWLFSSKRPSPRDKISYRLAVLVGLAYLILPGALIALSSKYQERGWIDWGYSYLPVYVSAFGALACLSCLLQKMSSSSNKVIRITMGVAVLFVCSIGSLIVYGSNQLQTERSNILFRYDRDIAESALRSGLFDSIPNDSYLIVGTEAYPAQLSSFYATHQSHRFRKIAGRGSYLGKPFATGGFFDPLYLSKNIVNMPFSKQSLIGSDQTGERHVFQAKDHIYYFYFQGQKEGSGSAMVCPVSMLYASDDHLRAVSGVSCDIFLKGQTSIANNTLPTVTIRSGLDWRILRIQASNKKHFDFKRLCLLINKLITNNKPRQL